MTPKKIMVVDDEEMITRLCRKVLEKQGFEVRCASSGEEALRLAGSRPFDMLLTDMLMPGLSGLDTFHILKEKQPGLVGLLMTAYGTMDTAVKAMEGAFSGFLRKPFTPYELTHVVKETFLRVSLLEENTRLKTLLPLYRLGEKFISSQSRQEILDALMDTIEHHMGTQRTSVMLYNDEEGCLKIAAARGMNKDLVSEVRIRPGEKIAGRVFETGEPLILNGGPEDNPSLAAFMKTGDIAAAISFPLKTRDRNLGVLNISRVREATPFCRADIEMLSIICGQAVMAMENLRIAEERAEKMRIRTLFAQYVAPEVTELLMSRGIDPMSIGEVKDIAILFADIKNFTPLVRSLPLEIIRSFLNDFFALLSEAIFSFEGTLDKFMGDAVLSFFGAPVAVTDPAHKAVRSAMMMQETFLELKKAWIARNRAFHDIGLGVGISYGETFLGNVGSPKRFDYTVVGIDVNVAQRLASAASKGQTLVTEKVKALLSTNFHVIEEPSRLLKGLEEPMAVFSLAKA